MQAEYCQLNEGAKARTVVNQPKNLRTYNLARSIAACILRRYTPNLQDKGRKQ